MSSRGYTHSPERRALISAANSGVPKSDEHRRKISEALHGRTKTDNVNYHIVHARMGDASAHICDCGAQARDWAYQYTATVELVSPEGWPYSTDPADYKPMCRPCHKRLDGVHHD